MALEVYNRKPHDRMTGIFSLGALFSEILNVITKHYPNKLEDYHKGKVFAFNTWQRLLNGWISSGPLMDLWIHTVPRCDQEDEET